MTRPTAAYVGMGLSHPIRLVISNPIRGNVAKLLSVDEALELMSDLTGAVARAVAKEHKKHEPRAAELPDRAADDPST